MGRPPRILISAGEASGDRLGAGLARALKRRRPDLELVGMGGAGMAEAGVRLIQDAAEVSVVGLFEVLAHLPAIRRAMGRLRDQIAREPPDLLVPIDFPDFNLRLAAGARRAGVDVVYFVSPQVWAWRRRRVKLIRRLVRRMLVLFPFEMEFYESAGVPVSFVGHPVMERVQPTAQADELRRRAGLSADHPTLALMPGSRRGEVERLLPPMLGAAAILRERLPQIQLLVPLAPDLPRQAVEGPIRASGLDGVRIHAGDFPAILQLCAAGVVASGTASLEAAVSGLPIVVVYRIHWLSYRLGRLLVDVEHIALPNLVAGRRLVPELIQGDCTPERIAAELRPWLEQPDRARAVRESLREVPGRLGGAGVFERAADALLDELAAVRGAGIPPCPHRGFRAKSLRNLIF